MKHEVLLDGSTAARAIPPVKVKTLLEEMGCKPQDSSYEYRGAIAAYLRDHITEKEMWSAMSTAGKLVS